MAKNKLITSGGLINQPPGGNSIILTQASRWHKDIGDFRRAVTEAERVDYPSRVKLYDLYEMALLDTHLTAVLQKRKAAVLKLKVEFTCNEKPDEKVAELIDSPWFSKFLSDLIDTYWWGFSLFQFYSDKNGWMNYEMVPRKHVDPIRELIMKRQTDIEGTPWAEYPDLLAVGNKRDLGELVKVLPLVLYKHGTMADWAQYAEIFGQPIREYVYPAQDDAERRRILADAFEDTGGSSVIIRSDMSSLNLIEPKNQGGSNDLYKAFVGLCNAEISKLVLGNTLSTEASERGTQSLGQIQVEGEQSIIDADKVRILNILNWEMAEIFNVFGYDTQSGRFSFVTPREIDLSTRIQIDMQIANKGVPIADDYFYETYGIPKPENYDQLKQPAKEEPEPAPDPDRSEPPRKKKSDPTPNKTDPDPGKDAKKTKAKGFRRFF
jgi:phage gp29-like protein